MSRVCEITKKKPMSGNNVSHSEIKTKRKFLPNLHIVSFLSDILGTRVRMYVSSRAIKTVEANGGIDAYLLNTGNSKLTPEARALKVKIQKCQAKKSATK